MIFSFLPRRFMMLMYICSTTFTWNIEITTLVQSVNNSPHSVIATNIYSVLSIYRGHYPLKISRKTSDTRIALVGEVWGVLPECKVWPKLYHCICWFVRIVLLYMTAIYRESIVYSAISTKVEHWTFSQANMSLAMGICLLHLNSYANINLEIFNGECKAGRYSFWLASATRYQAIWIRHIEMR